MKKYLSIKAEEASKLQRKLIKLLVKWQTGELTEAGVRDSAETLEERYYSGDYPESDLRSILVEALFGLANLEIQLFVKEDIPEFLAFVSAHDGPEGAWKRWNDYSKSIDWPKRADKLKEDPFYGL
ncbi:hypothetical protein [Marinobacter sp. R17]|uniref:hypothetical protein n=1 Tax=Marinobacter sp. R17 TaxID=2484250 RepID=UPI001680D621|nr:hypothetical protein [Marinobacter sp. R17]